MAGNDAWIARIPARAESRKLSSVQRIYLALSLTIALWGCIIWSVGRLGGAW